MHDHSAPLLDVAPPSAMHDSAVLSVVGIDVGGTKTHLIFEFEDGAKRETVVPSAQWRKDSLFSTSENLDRLAAVVHAHGSVTPRTSVAAGVHGIDNPAQVQVATTALVAALGTHHVAVVNDAELLGHAVGPQPSLQMIVGTGAVVVGRDAAGERLSALGYGWMLNDFGSAPGLVREAMRELLSRADRDELGDDPLADLLMAEYGAPDVTELALAMSDSAGLTEWGRLAPLVFRAADAGSTTAIRAIDDSARHLADGVRSVLRRGAVGAIVVAAGGVIVNQPRLQEALTIALRDATPHMRLVVLDGPPVTGAVALARSIAAVAR